MDTEIADDPQTKKPKNLLHFEKDLHVLIYEERTPSAYECQSKDNFENIKIFRD